MSNEQTAKTRPTHRLYGVSKEGDQTRWTELGAAWPHKDGKGFTIKQTACAIGEHDLVLRLIEQKAKTEKSGSRKNARANEAAQVAA